MKKILLAGVAAFALSFAMGAQAATVNVTAAANMGVVNKVGGTTQAATNIDINVGNITSSTLDQSATNLDGAVINKLDIDQTASFGNLALGLNAAAVAVNESVHQVAVNVTGSGAVSGSNLTGAATNVTGLVSNAATINVR